MPHCASRLRFRQAETRARAEPGQTDQPALWGAFHRGLLRGVSVERRVDVPPTRRSRLPGVVPGYPSQAVRPWPMQLSRWLPRPPQRLRSGRYESRGPLARRPPLGEIGLEPGQGPGEGSPARQPEPNTEQVHPCARFQHGPVREGLSRGAPGWGGFRLLSEGEVMPVGRLRTSHPQSIFRRHYSEPSGGGHRGRVPRQRILKSAADGIGQFLARPAIHRSPALRGHRRPPHLQRRDHPDRHRVLLSV